MGTLTVSGNEITDLIRAAARAPWPSTQQDSGMVDQYSVPGGFGIWRSATNLFRRGQCDTTSTDWAVSASGETMTVDATTAAPFSPQSIKVVNDGLFANQGIACFTNTGLAAAAGTVGVGSIYFKGVSGQTYTSRLTWFNTDASVTEGVDVNITATGSWQRVVVNNLAVAVGKTGDKLRLIFTINGTRSETLWFAHAMIETGRVAVAPYVPTSGGATATLNAARVQAPASLTNATQGWWAARLLTGFDSVLGLGFDAGLVAWGDNVSNRVEMHWDDTTKKWRCLREALGSITSTVAGGAFSVGDAATVIMAWTATTVNISVNGAAFVSTPNANIPTLASSTFDIGSRTGWAGAGTTQISSDVRWVAGGTGTLTDADPAALNAFGNTPPGLSTMGIGAAAVPTFIWNAVTASFDSGLDSVQRQLLGVGI